MGLKIDHITNINYNTQEENVTQPWLHSNNIEFLCWLTETHPKEFKVKINKK